MIHGNMGALATDETAPRSVPRLHDHGQGSVQGPPQRARRRCTATNRSDLLYDFEKDLIVELQNAESRAVLFSFGCDRLAGPGEPVRRRIGRREIDHDLGAAAPWLRLSQRRDGADRARHAARAAIPACTVPEAVAAAFLPAARGDDAAQLEPARADRRASRARDDGRLPLDAIFLLRYDPAAREPSLRPITAAEATARLFVHALNALAHPNMGLDAVLHIASHARCFDLTTARLPETCELVGSRAQGNGLPIYNPRLGRSVAQPGSALAWGARGPEFESRRSDQSSKSPPT